MNYRLKGLPKRLKLRRGRHLLCCRNAFSARDVRQTVTDSSMFSAPIYFVLLL